MKATTNSEMKKNEKKYNFMSFQKKSLFIL